MARRRDLLLAVLALVGCAGLQHNLADPTKRDLGSECASSAECPATTSCQHGRCEYDGKIVPPKNAAPSGPRHACAGDADCNADQICITGFCEARELTHQ